MPFWPSARISGPMCWRRDSSPGPGLERGRMDMLVRQAARKFGHRAAGELSHLFRGVSDPARVDEVNRALIKCAGDAEFLARAREAMGQSG